MKYKVVELSKHDYVVLRERGEIVEGVDVIGGKVFWEDIKGKTAGEIQHFFFRSSALRWAKRLAGKDLEEGKVIWSNDDKV